MRIYSLLRPRLIRQIIADVVALAAIIIAFVTAGRVRSQILEYRQYGTDLIDAGADITDVLHGFADQVRQIPFVGPALGDTLEGSVVIPDQLTEAGAQLQQAVTDFAGLAWTLIAILPLVCVLIAWLPWRVSFAAKSLETAKLARSEGGLDLLAERALALAPADAVLRIHPRPARALHHDDAVRDALAAIQLRSFGHRGARHVE